MLPESPVWLMANDRVDEARRVIATMTANQHEADEAFSDAEQTLEKMVSCESIDFTLCFECNSVIEHYQQSATPKSWRSLWKALTHPHIRKLLLVGCMLQAFQQFCGINTVMYYS